MTQTQTPQRGTRVAPVAYHVLDELTDDDRRKGITERRLITREEKPDRQVRFPWFMLRSLLDEHPTTPEQMKIIAIAADFQQEGGRYQSAAQAKRERRRSRGW